MRSIKKTNEDAVSPVVGVMLMLVVTIVIAAIVAAFAAGLATDVQPASNSVIKLDKYVMASNNGTGIEYGVFNKSIAKEYGLSANYGIANISFVHKGGDALNTKDLKLIITFNGASYSAPFSYFLEDNKNVDFIAGDVVKLSIANNADPVGFAYGAMIGQQNMGGGGKYGESPAVYYPPSVTTYDWVIIDASGNTIAKGTESTKLPADLSDI